MTEFQHRGTMAFLSYGKPAMKRYTRKNMTKHQVALLDHIHEELEKGNNPIPLECTHNAADPTRWYYCTPESLVNKKLIRIEYKGVGIMNVYPTAQGEEVAKRLYESKIDEVSFVAPGEKKPTTYIDVVSEKGTVRFYVGGSTIDSISKKLIAPSYHIETF